MTTPTPHPSGPDEPIAHVANDYNANGLSCHITEYLPAGMPLYARPSAMPALTDAMRAVLRNERDVYESEDALYAALCAAADLKDQASVPATPLGSLTSPHASPGGPGQPVPMPASEAVQEKAAPSDERVAFDRYLYSRNLPTERDGDRYALFQVQRAWEAWQARALLARHEGGK